MPLFTSETAAINGRKGAISRWTPKPAAEPIAIQPAIVPPIAEQLPDEFAQRLSSACSETLEKVIVMVRKEQTGKCAQLARALRDLRETWHLATGKPRPGLTRPDKQGPTRAPMPRVYPNVYSPDPPTGKPS